MSGEIILELSKLNKKEDSLSLPFIKNDLHLAKYVWCDEIIDDFSGQIGSFIMFYLHKLFIVSDAKILLFGDVCMLGNEARTGKLSDIFSFCESSKQRTTVASTSMSC